MISIFDVLKKPDFRDRLERYLCTQRKDYALVAKIPPLYKYCKLSDYTVKNLITKSLSFSLIATFNDCYDSRISFGDLNEKAIEEYEKHSALDTLLGCKPIMSIEQWHDQLTEEQKAYANFCSDSHCLCLSETSNSTLMWSHYSDNNRGLCIEYDLEQIKDNSLFHCLYPVCYTQTPINVYDLIRKNNETFSIELGVLVSVLNKAVCWDYEREWRLVLLNDTIGRNNTEKYITINTGIDAKSITLGYNFLDNFFVELNNDSEKDTLNKFRFFQLLAVIAKSRKIPMYQMSIDSKSFAQNSQKQIDIDFLVGFIQEAKQNHDFVLRNRKYVYLSFWEEFDDYKNRLSSI